MNTLKIILGLLLISLLLLNCEDIPNEIIEVQTVDYVVESVSAPAVFSYSSNNSALNTSIIIQNTETVKSVWFDIYTLNGSERISVNNFMTTSDHGHKQTFSGSVEIDENLLSGLYEIVYYAQDNVNVEEESVKKVATREFEFRSEAANTAPSIDNLDMPIEIDLGTAFLITLDVNDANGLSDIDSVYYQLRNSEGDLIVNSQGISKFPMFDNGDTEGNGDETANDGTFSVVVPWSSAANWAGIWEFSFNAQDKSGAISNTITQSLEVK